MWYIVAAFLFIIYLILNTVLPSIGTFGTYILSPLLWILLALTTILFAQKDCLSILKFNRLRRWNIGNSPITAALLIGGFQIALLILVGFIAGFHSSPYSFTPRSMLLNFFYVSTYLLGTEISRAYLLKRNDHSRSHSTIFLIVITLFFVLIQITPNQLISLQNLNPTVILEFIGSILITSIVMNLLASYLAYMGGATASIAYMGTILAFQWFCPVLPNAHWTIVSLIGTIAPTLGFMLLQDSKREPKEHKKRHHQTKHNIEAWIAVGIFGVLMIFFSFGYLGVTPTVVSSGSMSPALEVGDIVVVQKIDTTSVKPGDIIQFYKENTTILHRVIQIDTIQGNYQFITKGDANKDADISSVPATNILGKSVFIIPKLGWIQLFIKNILQSWG